jgi:DNA-binding CsgD family transcriptional regulator
MADGRSSERRKVRARRPRRAVRRSVGSTRVRCVPLGGALRSSDLARPRRSSAARVGPPRAGRRLARRDPRMAGVGCSVRSRPCRAARRRASGARRRRTAQAPWRRGGSPRVRARAHGPWRASLRGPRHSTLANAAGLTRREQEVLLALADGATNPQVAAKLHLSERTVAHHVSAILGKLSAPTRTAAVEAARRAGLLAGKDGPPPTPT